MFDNYHTVDEGDNPQPLIVSKNVIHRKEIQEMLLEMRQQKTKKTTEMKKEEEDKVVEAVSVSPERRRQTARTVTTHTSAPTSSIGVLVIACNRPTVTRALDLLLKLVIETTGILHNLSILILYVYQISSIS